jgi:hypothetical protein
LSNKEWHQRWFYLRSDADTPLLPYTDRFFEEAPERWGYGPITVDRKKIDTLLQAVKHLVDANRIGARVIAVFHKRRVLPLIRQACCLGEMVPNVALERIVLMMGELDHEDIKKHIKSVLRSVPFDAILDTHPLMHLDDDFIEMVSTPHSSSPPPFPYPLCIPFRLT